MRCLAAPCPVQLPEELARPQQALRETGFLGAPCKGPYAALCSQGRELVAGSALSGATHPAGGSLCKPGDTGPVPWPLSCPGSSRAWLFLTRRLMMALCLWTVLFSA